MSKCLAGSARDCSRNVIMNDLPNHRFKSVKHRCGVNPGNIRHILSAPNLRALQRVSNFSKDWQGRNTSAVVERFSLTTRKPYTSSAMPLKRSQTLSPPLMLGFPCLHNLRMSYIYRVWVFLGTCARCAKYCSTRSLLGIDEAARNLFSKFVT